MDSMSVQQELDMEVPEIGSPGRNSAAPSASDVEGFNEDLSQMLRSHFREKIKIKKMTASGPIVSFSFVISVSTPLSPDRLVELEAKAAKRKNQGGLQANVDPSSAIAHLHTEYAVLPGDNPLKTDVIFYATAARVFPDRHDPKTVKTWWADGQLWCSWTHTHSVLVTDALVRKLANHTVEFRVWDAREKLSQRARMDRPRGFRASELEGAPPSGAGGSISSLLGMAAGVVITQAKLHSQDQPRQVIFARPFAPTIRKHAVSVYKSEGVTGPTGRNVNSPVPTESKASDVHAVKVIPELGHQLRDYSQVAHTGRASADFEELKRRKRLNLAYRSGQAANAAMLQTSDSEKHENTASVASKQTTTSMAKRLRPSPNIQSDTNSKADAANSEVSNMRGMGVDLRSSLASVTTSAGGNLLGNLPLPSGVVQTVRLRLASLFDGRKSSTSRIVQPAGLVSDCLMSLIVDPSLLSENQTIRFRPVILRVVSAGPLPQNLVPNSTAYCQCLVPDFSPTPADATRNEDPKLAQARVVDELLNKDKVIHQQQREAELKSVTEAVQPFSNSAVYWNHSVAILTGDIPAEALRQNLLQRPFIVELHDREPPAQAVGQLQSLVSSTTTLNSNTSAALMKPAVFGSMPNDSQIASTAVLPPPPPEPPKPPYGVATILLNDLLVSHTGKGISFSEGTGIVKPKRPEPAKNSSETSTKKIPLPKYLECGTAIKVTARAPIPVFAEVELKPEVETTPAKTKKGRSATMAVPKPVAPPPPPEPVLQPKECIATLVIVIPHLLVSSENIDRRIDVILGDMVRSTAIDTNSDSLALAGLVAPEERAAALTAYQLAPDQQIDKSLNLVTGFHVADDDGVLIVVEGRSEIISRLWEYSMTYVHEFHAANEKLSGKVSIFYNSSLLSPIRRYGAMDLSYAMVTLGKGLSVIVAEPLLYVRDMAPDECRSAAVKIVELRASATSLADIFRRSLLPSAEELRSLYEEFAVKMPLSSLVYKTREFSHNVREPEDQVDEKGHVDGDVDIDQMLFRPRNFLRENLEGIWLVSEKNRLEREQTETLRIAVNTGHVYSSHSVNAIEIAKAHIRDHLLVGNRRYTFSQDYHHRTLTPRSASPERFSIYPHARKWQYPGHIDAIQANQHPVLPDKARLDELAEPWRENWLHERYLNPPLERDPLPWELRKVDFNLMGRPKLEKIHSSVFVPGDATQYPLESLMPPRDCRLRVYRRGVRSEQEDNSYKMSLLDRVSDILHDPPAKISLRYNSMREIPKISLVSGDFSNRNDKCIPFGPVHYNDWLLDRNILPLR